MKRKGFTLIELLVVISIIALLSSVVLSSLASARAKARDAQQRAVVRQIAHAVEMYRLDNGSYPPTLGWFHNACTPGTTTWVASTPFYNALVPKYLPSIYCPKINTMMYVRHDYDFGSSACTGSLLTTQKFSVTTLLESGATNQDRATLTPYDVTCANSGGTRVHFRAGS